METQQMLYCTLRGPKNVTEKGFAKSSQSDRDLPLERLAWYNRCLPLGRTGSSPPLESPSALVLNAHTFFAGTKILPSASLHTSVAVKDF